MIYDYRCDSCSHEFGVRKPMRESDTSEACPQCRRPARKLISRSSFLLKGGGWFKDRYGLSTSPGG